MSRVRIFNEKINFDEFEIVPDPKLALTPMAVNISPSGLITLNDKFRSNLKKTEFCFKISKDKKKIIIDEVSESNYKFQKNGTRKDIEFTRNLSKSGVELPARYLMEFSQEYGVWIGQLFENTKSQLELVLTKTMNKKGQKHG